MPNLFLNTVNLTKKILKKVLMTPSIYFDENRIILWSANFYKNKNNELLDFYVFLINN